METFVAFLRAINVGGRRVRSDDLSSIFYDLAFEDVNTYLASGNVIFQADALPAPLESRIEEGLADALGFDVATFVRPLSDLTEIVSASFLERSADRDHLKTYVVFSKSALTPQQEDTLHHLATDVDQFSTQGRHIFWERSVEAGESRSTGELESALDAVLTRRTTRTLQRIIAKFG